MGESLLKRAIRLHGADKVWRSMTRQQRANLRYMWRYIGRPEQQMPAGDWRVWLLLAGRGFGKTRTGSEVLHQLVRAGRVKHIALVGETAADTRDVMVENHPSSLVKTAPPSWRPKYEPSKRRLTWPNGVVGTLFSADDPEQLRGPEHDFVWADELGKWKHAKETWSNLEFGLRRRGPKGDPPRVMITTTPRVTPQILALAKGERQLDGSYVRRPDVVVTTGSTYDNADNLDASFLDAVRREYEGTSLGDQELWAKILDEIEGALWTHDLIDQHRVRLAPPSMHRIVVAVDPPASELGAEAGIVAAGSARGDYGAGDVEDHHFVLSDVSRKGKPSQWAKEAVDLYKELRADCIVAEVNNGGDMVKHTIQSIDADVPVKVVHASRGKRVRAEPISTMYEQGRVHHVGAFPKLEDQMATWVPANGQDSPDRMDALVWAISELKDRKAPALPVGPRIVAVSRGSY